MNDNLFIERIKKTPFNLLEKLADFKLKNDHSQWPKEIISYFHTEYPALSQVPVRVSFTQIDEERGYAIGALYVGDNQKIALPIIVDEYMLSPMDIGVMGNNVFPFTESTIDIVMTNPSAFAGTVRNEDVDTVKRLFSNELDPSDTGFGRSWHEREVKASYEGKIDDLMNDIVNTITAEQKENFLKKIASYKQYYEHNGTWKFAEDVEALTPSSTVVEDILAARMLPRDIYMIEKTGNWDYTVVVGSSEYDNALSMEVSADQVKNVHDFLEKSSAVREYMEKTANSYVSKQYGLKSFDGSNRTSSLLIDGEFNYMVSEDMSSDIVDYKKLEKVGTFEASVGDFGVFFLDGGVSNPVFIEKIAEIDGNRLVDVSDGMSLTKLGFNHLIKSTSVADATDEVDYWLPYDHSIFMKLAEERSNMSDMSHAGPNWVSTDGEGKFYFGGPTLTKYSALGHQIDDIDEFNAKWTMVQLGVAPEEMKKIEMNKYAKYYFHSDLTCPEPFSTFVETLQEKVAEAIRSFDDVNLDFTKLAADLPENDTVDSVLSLGFLNKKNIANYIEYIPMYEETMNSLAKLLLGIRLGNELVPEDSAKEAMENLSDVVRKLYEVETMLKNKQK